MSTINLLDKYPMKCFYLIILVLGFGQCLAQDTLIKTNGDELFGKVWEINNSEVKYTPSSNPNGPKYGIAKNEVFVIKYKNGTRDKIIQDQPQVQPAVTYPITYIQPGYGYPRQPAIYYTAPAPPITAGKIDNYAGDYYRGSILLSHSQLNRLLLENGNIELKNITLKADKEREISKGFGTACAPLMAVGFALGGLTSGIVFLYEGYSNGSTSYRSDPFFQMVSTMQIAGFGLGGLGLTSMGLSIGFKISSEKKLNKALAIYNYQYK